jgi:hypothetical protein
MLASLALRLHGICSAGEILHKRLAELKTLLLSRNYNKNVVNAALQKAKSLDKTLERKK